MQAKAASVAVNGEFPEEELWLEGDPTLLERALFNLLENAVKFSPSEGRVTHSGSRVRMIGWSVRSRTRDRVSRIACRGISSCRSCNPPPVAAREFRGVGLGLSFVKVVAEKHRGRVFAANGEAGGARFIFELPAQPASAD
ncbi:MAG: ATP-binding protein [Candidatus Thiodiazotropha sp.]